MVARDCNTNGVDDYLEIWQGTADDCDGRPDSCDLGITADATFDGIPTTRNRLVFETADLAAIDPLADTVTVRVVATGDFDASNEFLTVLFDGTFLGFAFNAGGANCGEQVASFEIPRATWESAAADGSRAFEVYASPTVDPAECAESRVSISVAYLGVPVDCNGNGLWDGCDLGSGDSTDLDGDGVPDECQPDCDADGQPDAWAVSEGLVPDCNANGEPDSCDIAGGVSNDVDTNGVPDECKPDCNGNGLPDAYEIAIGSVADCNDNGTPDPCDIAAGTEDDCDGDDLIDFCAVLDGAVSDCNDNGNPDSCDIGRPGSEETDDNGNGIPDSCDLARGDLDLDGCVGPSDLGFLLALWGLPNPPTGDLDGDGTVGASDLGFLLSNWDGCP